MITHRAAALALLLLTGCLEFEHNAEFASADSKALTAAVDAALGSNAYLAGDLFDDALRSARETGCPRIEERKSRILLTGGCSAPDGARYEGEAQRTAWSYEPAAQDEEKLHFQQFEVSSDGEYVHVQGLVTWSSDEDQDVRDEQLSVTVRGDGGVVIHSDVRFVCDRGGCDWRPGAEVSDVGLGRFNIRGYLEGGEGELALYGVDALKVDLGTIDAAGCAAATIGDQPAEPVCSSLLAELVAR